MVRSRYVILEVAQKLRLSTKGNASGSPVYLDLEIPGFLENLPWATQLDLFTLVEQASTNFFFGGLIREI